MLNARQPGHETGPRLLEHQLHAQPQVQAALDLQRGPGNGATGSFLQLRPPVAVPGLLRDLPLPHLNPEEDRSQPFVTAEFVHVKPILSAEFKTSEAYSALVRRTFGSYRSYYEFAKESDAQVERVRHALDKQPTVAAQTIFYRWVRGVHEAGLEPSPDHLPENVSGIEHQDHGREGRVAVGKRHHAEGAGCPFTGVLVFRSGRPFRGRRAAGQGSRARLCSW